MPFLNPFLVGKLSEKEIDPFLVGKLCEKETKRIMKTLFATVVLTVGIAFGVVIQMPSNGILVLVILTVLSLFRNRRQRLHDLSFSIISV